ncbi:uncharacterized protein LOC106084739, partial [Stomoxys calcitrans]|uniref:uncharacterized protein LOC106084739 n=1 Tax=Stomoxys calcitrans TaxID=35570 RepID=UPI0027E31091
YEEIEKELEELQGIVVTIQEINTKLHNLTNNEKKNIGSSGGSPSSWPLYQKVHDVLGPFRKYNLEDVV